MAISLRGTAANSAASGDVTVTLPGVTAAGDVVYAANEQNSSGDTNIDMDMVTAGYTELADLRADDTSDCNLGVFRKVMGLTPDSVAVFKDAIGGQDSDAIVMVLAGADVTTPEDAAVTTATGIDLSTTAGIAPDPPSITTLTAGAWVIAVGAATESDDPTAPTNYSNLIRSSDQGGCVAMATREIVSPTAENPGAFGGVSGTSFGHPDSWCAATVAVRPASVATGRSFGFIFG